MAAEFGLRHASTGDIFREAVRSDNELGRTVRDYLDGGQLVPDELTSRVVRQMVVERTADYVLDGYPRTVGQADDLETMLRERGEALDAAVAFELDEETAVRRLTGRLVCKECGRNYHRDFMPPQRAGTCDACGGALVVRTDSAEHIVRKRIAEYQQKTSPLLPYYDARGLLKTVDARPDPGEVAQQTREVLRALGANA